MGEVNKYEAQKRELAKKMNLAQAYGGVHRSAILTASQSPMLKWYLDNGAKIICDVETGDGATYSCDLPPVPTSEWYQ